jgi:glycerophosphoryl diester phosphodiesterase
MTPAFFRSERPLVFAHRGGSGLAPENTLTAFEQGLALGADGLELDVRLSRDGVVVVHHDALLNRTTNLQGPVEARTAEELTRADAGWHFHRNGEYPFRGRGIGVPRLSEVLARFPDARIIIELKSDRVELAQAVVEVVRAADAVDRVCIGSFAFRGLRAVRELEPAIATSAAQNEVVGCLLRLWCRRPFAVGPFQGFQVPVQARGIRVVTAGFVVAAHQAGLGVQVWTVDQPELARRLLAYGVDGLITDRPDLIVPLPRSD